MDEQFTETRDPRVRAERHSRLARQYFYLAEKASSPFLRADYQRRGGVSATGEGRIEAHGTRRRVDRRLATAPATGRSSRHPWLGGQSLHALLMGLVASTAIPAPLLPSRRSARSR
jgi:hypothetical protein